ncbi:hypothetical protein GWI33_019109 [Rhynchophorus ferrugineus]|uniref:NADPH oxidase 5 n=1 Tax=Rhynchophorus ferrugineus TaxID=354439 RepID=A0A834HRY9_RHYFE|nr:hypothetical protein GWI33_019109 [Rhynchophorus ferrugineus]
MASLTGYENTEETASVLGYNKGVDGTDRRKESVMQNGQVEINGNVIKLNKNQLGDVENNVIKENPKRNSLESSTQTLDLIRDQQFDQKSGAVQSRSIGVGTHIDIVEEVPSCSKSASCALPVDEGTIIRRRSLVPMSSMEEENLRERLHLAHLRLCSEIVNKEQKYTRDGFRKLLQSKDLSELLFKLFDQDRSQTLPQEQWVEFLKQRMTNEKQIDFVEQLESVAFCLCGDEPIKQHQFYQIINAKGISDKLFRLIDEDNTGAAISENIMEFLATITNTRPRTGIDQNNLARLEQLFRQTVGKGTEIRREDFQKIVSSKNPFFTERVFQIFDKDNSGSISLQEFLDAMHQFAGQSPEDKIRFLFKVYDIDGDGLIQHKELQHVMRACMEENGMQFSEEQIEDLTVAMFEDADTCNRGAITYEALKNQLEKHGGLLENLSISIDRWLVPPPLKPNSSTSLFRRIISYRPYYFTIPYIRNNLVYLAFLLGFIMVNAALFVSRAFQYRESNWYTIFARACGQCLNFDCMFILVLMLRRCITFLRTRGYGSVLPLDQHIYFHKLTGWLIFGFSFWHSAMHVFNFSLVIVNDPKINSQNFTTAEWLFTSRPGLLGLIPGWANPTGIALFFILLVMFICSQAFVRRGGCFEIFYWTHLMYIPFWILLIIHGPRFWMWFIIPAIAYTAERISRVDTMSSKGKTYISSGLLLPSMVTHLVIKRPSQFDFHPGDYIFVNIPAIAKYEWHPFTISSAPEQEDYMWLHIRGVGQWTNRLYEYFEREQVKLHNGEINRQACSSKACDNTTEKTNNNALTQMKETITRTLSREKSVKKKSGVQLVGFSNDHFDETSTPSDCNNRSKRIIPDKRLQRLLFSKRAPLEKSLSLPDVQNNVKKRERILALREYMRSESEKSFDQCQMRKARMKSLGLAYLSPQNKSLAQSFRYMRNKPTIIAFKTPSLENCEKKDSSTSFISTLGNTSDYYSPERRVEEGQVFQLQDMTAANPKLKPFNYPVGKPLELYNSKCLDNTSRIDMVSDIKVKYSDNGGTEIFLDGPYGAPSSHIFRAQHAVLIATGIGVTPFASILQSIMHKYWKARHTCPKCKYAWASDIPASIMNLRKVDFFWINRNQRSFEWFVNLLSQLEIEQAELGGAMERFLEMHMYITSALQKTDMKAVGLQLALDLLHEKEKRDLITGLKTRTNAGRPNWDKVFKQISDQKKGKVTLFYCGPPQLGRILKVKCDQFGFIFRKESF